MSDVMHGPAVSVQGRTRRKAYLIAFLDDATRVVPYAAFTLSENTATFLPVFKRALMRRGLPQRLSTTVLITAPSTWRWCAPSSVWPSSTPGLTNRRARRNGDTVAWPRRFPRTGRQLTVTTISLPTYLSALSGASPVARVVPD